MNKYLIKYKISTVAHLREPFNYNGYEFSAYDPHQWWNCDGWVASKIIEEKDSGHARYKFLSELFPIIPELSILSQCAFRFTANTYFIYKTDNNPKKIIFIHYVKGEEPVGLDFDEEEKANLTKISNIPNKNALFFLADAANATTFYTKLTMLLIGIEGLAGEETFKDRKRTNQKVLKEILGESLYKKLYPYGEGLRNLLFHGSVKDHKQYEGLTDKLYACIMTYLKSEYNISLEENVVHPQRNFYDNFTYTDTFEAFKNEPILDLKYIHDTFEKNEMKLDIYTYMGESPEDY